MGRMYTTEVNAVAVTAAQDFFEVNAPSDGVVVIHSAFIGQTSDAGDAAAEILGVQISRTDNSVAGSGGSVVTARPHEVGDSAFGGTTEVNNTTQTTVTTELRSEAFNVQAGWFYQPAPGERIVISPSGTVVVEITVPADSLTMHGSITFEEIGG